MEAERGEQGLGAVTERRPPNQRRKRAAYAAVLNVVRDERVVCAVERASSRGTGRREARGAEQTMRWSRRFGSFSFVKQMCQASSTSELNQKYILGALRR